MMDTWFAKGIRTLTSSLPVSKKRFGSCVNCGACCKLPNLCPFLRFKQGKSCCVIYPIRSLNCRKYPRTGSEFVTQATCGFKFKK